MPEYEKIESLRIEKLTIKKRTAEQKDGVNPRAPKALKPKAEPGEEPAAPKAAAAKPRAKAKAKALSEIAKSQISRAELNLQEKIEEAEHLLAELDPNVPADAEVPKRFLTALEDALNTARKTAQIMNDAIAADVMPPEFNMTTLKKKAVTDQAELVCKMGKVEQSRAD